MSKNKSHQYLKAILSNPDSSDLEIQSAREAFSRERSIFKRISRQHLAAKDGERDTRLFNVIKNSSSLKSIKRIKAEAQSKISELVVGDNTFYGEDVCEGFYQNMVQLKSSTCSENSCQLCSVFDVEVSCLRELCLAGNEIPSLSFDETQKLLKSLKPHVCDHCT